MMQKVKNHLKDNLGEAYLEKMILICIAFVIGAVLIKVCYDVIGNENFQNGMGNSIENIFNW